MKPEWIIWGVLAMTFGATLVTLTLWVRELLLTRRVSAESELSRRVLELETRPVRREEPIDPMEATHQQAESPPVPLTGAKHRLYLELCYQNEPETASDLAEYSGLSESYTRKLLLELENDGIAVRTPEGAQRRHKWSLA